MRRACALVAALLALTLAPVLGTAEAAPTPAPTPASTPASTPKPPVAAKPTSGKVATWPKGRIRYLDRSQDPDAVAAAVRIWNTSGAKVRFVKARNPARARLVIRNSTKVPAGCGSGTSDQGWPGRTGTAYVDILHGADSAGQRCATPGQTLVLVHLLGRVLGLKDNDRTCSAMNTTQTNGVAPSRCVTRTLSDGDEDPGRWRCSPLTARDLKVVTKRYGGTPAPVPADPWCQLVPLMPSAGAFSVTLGTDGDATGHLERLAEPALPAYLARSSTKPGFEIHQTVGACTAVRDDFDTVAEEDDWAVPVGGTQSIDLSVDTAGPTCWTAFVTDNLGRYAVAGSTTVVTVTDDDL